MSLPRLIFFGSFQHYSAIILEQLIQSSELELVGVVTTPPQPTGKSKALQPNPTHLLAEKYHIPVRTPELLSDEELTHLQTAWGDIDYFVTAGYGKLLPDAWLNAPHLGALNLHFSLLPKLRGANPAEWALLLDERELGVTMIEMSPEFDTGTMIAQAGLTITHTDTRETLYEKLYTLGGDVLPEMVSVYHSFRTGEPRTIPTSNAQSSLTKPVPTFMLPPISQPPSPTPYAKKLSREDGFIAWTAVSRLIQGETANTSQLSPTLEFILEYLGAPLTAAFVERATRALAGFPSLWTLIPTSKGEKRMKLIVCSVAQNSRLILEKVQIEGQGVALWNQVKNVLV